MTYAEIAKQAIDNRNAEIIATKCEPNKAQIMGAIIRGIERIGYVVIDTFHNTSTAEGRECGKFDHKELNALKEFIEKEGFKVSRMWWGMSSDGDPDMLKITLG